MFRVTSEHALHCRPEHQQISKEHFMLSLVLSSLQMHGKSLTILHLGVNIILHLQFAPGFRRLERCLYCFIPRRWRATEMTCMKSHLPITNSGFDLLMITLQVPLSRTLIHSPTCLQVCWTTHGILLKVHGKERISRCTFSLRNCSKIYFSNSSLHIGINSSFTVLLFCI